VSSALDHQLRSTVYGSLGIAGRLDLAVAAPLLVSSGDDPVLGSGLEGAAGVAGGDLRVSVKGALLNSAGLGLALLEEVTAPTATGGSFSGDEGPTSTTRLVADYAGRGWRLAANAGLRLRGTREVGALDVGSELLLGAAASVPLRCGVLEVVGSAEGRTALSDPLGSRYTNALDLLGGGRLHLGRLSLSTVAGGGLLSGFGSAALQAIVQVAWEPEETHRCAPLPPPDRDGDGVADAEDACVEVAGLAATRGCPDGDGDGVADGEDACPDAAGPGDGDGCPDRDRDGLVNGDDGCPDVAGTLAAGGCPDPDGDGVGGPADVCPELPGLAATKGCPDGDGDGIVDPEDRCPDHPGTAGFHGCTDRDGDGVSDADDACPDVAGSADRQGCPAERVVLSTETRELRIHEDVRFHPGRSVVASGSLAILDEIARVLTEHPEITRVQVEGHTDKAGSARLNRVLSQHRAEAVVRHLVRAGVAPERLTAKGFGDTRPIADNGTADGRARNRRVAFTILETTPTSEAPAEGAGEEPGSKAP